MVVNFLSDTNVAIYQLQNRLAEQLPAGTYFLSVISEIELLAYPALTVTEERKIKTLLKALHIMPLTEAIKCVLLTNDEQIARKKLVATRACLLR